MIGGILYVIVRLLVALLEILPLALVARLGRFGGTCFYWLDARHRRVALRNLEMCFGSEMDRTQQRAIARENFRRIGENFASAVKTSTMSFAELQHNVEFVNTKEALADGHEPNPRSRVFAVGHFGNFELLTHFGQIAPSYRTTTTYRGLDHPALDRLLRSLRARSGCMLFERRTEVKALRAALASGGFLLGLLVDQHAGRRGVRIPFLGHECSTSPAPAVFALRYDCPLHTAVCYRVGLARWRIEAGKEIPTRENARPRPVEAIMRDVNAAFEAAVRRDPANWFWVHNRWKPAPPAFVRPGARLGAAAE